MKEDRAKKQTTSRTDGTGNQEKGSRGSSRRGSRGRGGRSGSRRSDEQAKQESKAKEAPEEKPKAAEEEEPVPMTPEELREELEKSQRPFSEWEFLSEALKEGIRERGYVDPTPVQTIAVEPAMTGKDLVVQAKTGTGKTAAFGIPLLERLEAEENKKVRALILTPTRELARQVAEELSGLGKPKGASVLAIYGGIQIKEQLQGLKDGVDIVVGTPGRVLDHIRRRSLNTMDIRQVVLDEADEMLSMGFYMEVSDIIESCKKREQLMLFSATIPQDIEGLVRQFTNKPIRLMISGDDRKVEGISHYIYFSDERLPRPRNLLYIIEHLGPEAAIIFCNTREESAMVASYLLRQGKHAEAIHGDVDQRDREKVLDKLRDGKVQFLVATDVAARGIDISSLTHIINYNFPRSIDVYLHRAGRTGRQGRDGVAASMVDGGDIYQIVQLRRLYDIFFEIKSLPPAEEIVRSAAARHIEQLFTESMDMVIEPFLPLADAMRADERGRYIVAYLLKLYHEEHWQALQETLQRLKQEGGAAALERGAIEAQARKETPPPQAPQETKETQAPKETKEAQRPASNEKDAKDAKDAEEENDEGASDSDSDSVRLYLSIGVAEGYSAESLRQMVSKEAGVPRSVLGAVQMERHYAFIHVDTDASTKILEVFQERPVGDHRVTAEVAKKQTRRRRR